MYDCLENHGHRFKEDNVSRNMLDQLISLTSRKNHFSPDRDWMPLKLVKASPAGALASIQDDEEVAETRSRTKSPAKNMASWTVPGTSSLLLIQTNRIPWTKWSKIFSNRQRQARRPLGRARVRGKGRRGRGKKN